MKDQELLDLLFTSDWKDKYTESQYIYLLKEYKKLVHRVCAHNKTLEYDITSLKKEVEELKEQSKTINKNLIELGNKLDWYRHKYDRKLTFWERLTGNITKEK